MTDVDNLPDNIYDLRRMEGFDKLNKSKQEELEYKFREQKKMKELEIEDFNPWGKPGHGAPNEDTLRKRKIFMDVLPPIVFKPVGNDLTLMGRPGGGAPVRTKSGKLKNARVEDPQLRFQFGPGRRMVDIDLRYRVPIVDQKAYKEALDELIKEKKYIDKDTKKDEDIVDRELGIEGGTFRRLGSHPQDNKDLIDKFPELVKESARMEDLTGGIELEPLLAIKRTRAKKHPLSTTDVTSVYDIKPNISISEKEYSEALDQQIYEREHHKEEECEEEKLTARKHFENWDTFWGRPGYGAPKAIKVKENLDYILYHLPILVRKADLDQTDDEDSVTNQDCEQPEN